MPELALWAWPLLALAAATIGISKTAVPGGSILAIAIFATLLPPRTSTAAMLLLLIVGDVFALLVYRKHAHWPTLLRLAPAVVLGLLIGFAFLVWSNDAIIRRAIGVILLLMIALTLWRRRRQATAESTGGAALAVSYGTLGGFTTMVANAGGPVMSMYFLATRTPVQVFLGTSAWFFATVNIVKVPFLASIGLMEPSLLLMDAALVPAVVGGALLGIWLAKKMDQQLFDRVVIVLTVIGATYLLF